MVREQTKGLAVMVVDDSRSDRRLMELVLEEIPDSALYGSYTGPDMLDDLEGFWEKESSQPLLALIDINLGPHRGLELLQELKQRHRGSSIMVMMMSGQEDWSTWERAYDAGANACWTKPMDLHQMRTELAAALRFFGSVNPDQVS